MAFYTISSVYQTTALNWHQQFLHFLFKLFILCPAVMQRCKAVVFLRYFWKQEEYRIVPASACKWECCCYLKTTILEPHLSGCHTADMTGVQFFSLILQINVGPDNSWWLGDHHVNVAAPPSSSFIISTHTHRQKCSFALTTGCCWFQLVEPTSDTRTLESLLIGWSFRSACVKGNWGQTVDPQDKKRFKEWQKGGTEGGERGRQTWPI